MFSIGIKTCHFTWRSWRWKCNARSGKACTGC